MTMAKDDLRPINRKQFLRRTAGSLVGVTAACVGVPTFIPDLRASNVPLQYRTIGKTGLKVTAVGLGGSRTNEPSVMKRVIDSGVNFVDTGRMYAGGRNEEMIGRVIADVRKDIVIQSKIDQKIQKDAVAMMKSIEDSCKALRTDYIDIMLIRGATTTEMVHNEIVHEVFNKAKEQGKIRFCGFSCHSSNAPDMMREGIDTGVYDVIMVPYNHSSSFRHSIYGIYSEWDQSALESSFEMADKAGVGVAVMKTCSGGPMPVEGKPRGSYQEGLRWILKNKHVSVMAVGMASFREVTEDLGAMG